MSSLIFYTDENQAFIATDTLAVSNDGKPFKFVTKAFIVPHLRMIIAGTGCGGFCDKWFSQVNDRMIIRGIDNLNFHTPKNLADNWHSYKHEFSIPDHLTTTIYHFGFSEEVQLIRSYAYRSTTNFKSELLPCGIAVKPKCKVPEPYELPKDFINMMNEQRALQALEAEENKVYIGGEIQVIHLTTNGFSAYSLGRFDDFYEDEEAIYSNYRRGA